MRFLNPINSAYFLPSFPTTPIEILKDQWEDHHRRGCVFRIYACGRVLTAIAASLFRFILVQHSARPSTARWRSSALPPALRQKKGAAGSEKDDDIDKGENEPEDSSQAPFARYTDTSDQQRFATRIQIEGMHMPSAATRSSHSSRTHTAADDNLRSPVFVLHQLAPR